MVVSSVIRQPRTTDIRYKYARFDLAITKARQEKKSYCVYERHNSDKMFVSELNTEELKRMGRNTLVFVATWE